MAAAPGALRKTAADVRFEELVAMFEELQTRGNKGHANVRKNMLGRFRASFLPPEPDAELCFQVYRLIMPQVRLGAAACARGRRGR